MKIQGLSESHKRNFRNRENLGIWADLQCLTSLAHISLLSDTQERKQARTEYQIRILNLNFEFEFEAE